MIKNQPFSFWVNSFGSLPIKIKQTEMKAPILLTRRLIETFVKNQ